MAEVHYTGIQAEAREMALCLINGDRKCVHDFIAGHDTPAQLCLAIVRHLITLHIDTPGHSAIQSVVNVQSLIENLDV